MAIELNTPLDTNAVSKNERHVNQGARPTERDENSRIGKVNKTTGESKSTEDSENKRISTVGKVATPPVEEPPAG